MVKLFDVPRDPGLIADLYMTSAVALANKSLEAIKNEGNPHAAVSLMTQAVTNVETAVALGSIATPVSVRRNK